MAQSAPRFSPTDIQKGRVTATTTSGERTVRRQVPQDLARILGDCRDLAIHRLLLSFTSLLDRVGDLLMARAERSGVREEQTLCLDSRAVLIKQRNTLMVDFERNLRKLVDERIAGRSQAKGHFSEVEVNKLTLVDTTAMDESVLSSNIIRVVENQCETELRELNRGIGYLLGRPDLETAANPLAPTTIVEAFAQALHGIGGDERIKLAILKELNQTSLGDINAIYADLNRHIEGLQILPKHRAAIIRSQAADRSHAADRAHGDGKGEQEAVPAPEIDLMALLQRLVNANMAMRSAAAKMPAGLPPGGIQVPSLDGAGPPSISMGFPAGAFGFAAGGGAGAQMGSLGQMGGQRILITPELADALGRLQHGETGFDFGGVPLHVTGLQQDMHNVLRDIQESPLGERANQLEAMTIELVAMLFDFIFETRDLPDSIKALVGRLQIPVLKAAMLDGAFFSKKSHPSRLLVNALADAGIGWSPTMGQDDPLYRKIEQIVHRVLDDFTDDVGLFDELRKDLEAFLADEERAAEVTIQSTADEINQRDHHEIAQLVARSEIERRLREFPAPNFLASFLREKWLNTLTQVHLNQGEESEAWNSALATLDDLVWSVQPKRQTEDRRRLVAMLRNLLKQLHGGLHNVTWEPGERETFMSNLVEAHAAAVKPSLASTPLPTVAVAEAATAAAEQATAKGDIETANKARALAEAMTPAPQAPEPEPVPEPVQDRFAEVAASLERGMWVEFEGEDGHLAFAKLAWVSPLRGTYLFTNRQGQKAVSLTADELAERFRTDRARLVEAAPLVDRAFVSMIAKLEEKFGSDVTPAPQAA
ncbi:MAG TPA: DUF1631 domain-containing protein [Casimicrobiaceae bacterium]|nr:DUF1631 domain-containing protein [Casimicrobiaceae bacterium]